MQTGEDSVIATTRQCGWHWCCLMSEILPITKGTTACLSHPKVHPRAQHYNYRTGRLFYLLTISVVTSSTTLHPTKIPLEFFAPNMAPFVQPLDAGIICCFKAHYWVLYRFITITMLWPWLPVGRNLDNTLNATGGGPYSFRIHGELVHRVGYLLPQEGHQPVYSQTLYPWQCQLPMLPRIPITIVWQMLGTLICTQVLCINCRICSGTPILGI